MARYSKRRRTLPADTDEPSYKAIALCNEFDNRMTYVSFFGHQNEFKECLKCMYEKWQIARLEHSCHCAAYQESLMKCTCFLTHILCACACILYVERPMQMIGLIEDAFDDASFIETLRLYTYNHAKQMYLDLGGYIRAVPNTPELYRLVGLKKRVHSMGPSVLWKRYFEVMKRSSANMHTQTMYLHFILHYNMNDEVAREFRLDNNRLLVWNEQCMKWLVEEKDMM